MQGADKLNADIKAWGKKSLGDLKQEFARLKIIHREDSPSPIAAIDALRNSFNQRQGIINKISFKFPRHMVFVHKGVGKGRPISHPGKAKEWFNPVMDRDVEALGDIVAENMGDIVADNLLIKLASRKEGCTYINLRAH